MCVRIRFNTHNKLIEDSVAGSFNRHNLVCVIFRVKMEFHLPNGCAYKIHIFFAIYLHLLALSSALLFSVYLCGWMHLMRSVCRATHNKKCRIEITIVKYLYRTELNRNAEKITIHAKSVAECSNFISST